MSCRLQSRTHRDELLRNSPWRGPYVYDIRDGHRGLSRLAQASKVLAAIPAGLLHQATLGFATPDAIL